MVVVDNVPLYFLYNLLRMLYRGRNDGGGEKREEDKKNRWCHNGVCNYDGLSVGF